MAESEAGPPDLATRSAAQSTPQQEVFWDPTDPNWLWQRGKWYYSLCQGTWATFFEQKQDDEGRNLPEWVDPQGQAVDCTDFPYNTCWWPGSCRRQVNGGRRCNPRFFASCDLDIPSTDLHYIWDATRSRWEHTWCGETDNTVAHREYWDKDQQQWVLYARDDCTRGGLRRCWEPGECVVRADGSCNYVEEAGCDAYPIAQDEPEPDPM